MKLRLTYFTASEWWGHVPRNYKTEYFATLGELCNRVKEVCNEGYFYTSWNLIANCPIQPLCLLPTDL